MVHTNAFHAAGRFGCLDRRSTRGRCVPFLRTDGPIGIFRLVGGLRSLPQRNRHPRHRRRSDPARALALRPVRWPGQRGCGVLPCGCRAIPPLLARREGTRGVGPRGVHRSGLGAVAVARGHQPARRSRLVGRLGFLRRDLALAWIRPLDLTRIPPRRGTRQLAWQRRRGHGPDGQDLPWCRGGLADPGLAGFCPWPDAAVQCLGASAASRASAAARGGLGEPRPEHDLGLGQVRPWNHLRNLAPLGGAILERFDRNHRVDHLPGTSLGPARPRAARRGLVDTGRPTDAHGLPRRPDPGG